MFRKELAPTAALAVGTTLLIWMAIEIAMCPIKSVLEIRYASRSSSSRNHAARGSVPQTVEGCRESGASAGVPSVALSVRMIAEERVEISLARILEGKS